MSRSLKCLQCSSTFIAPSAGDNSPVACPQCGGTRVVAQRPDATSKPNGAPMRPPLTDDDVLAFIGSPPTPKARPKM
ncbi:MAG TPA: hypothetical protein VG125_02460 [Pirellulales bacterium]|jgi:DNA-directed RNA polymerase subunit RPC12/RpoP|nr:hypothetical protein [Pirellulales bacterium]